MSDLIEEIEEERRVRSGETLAIGDAAAFKLPKLWQTCATSWGGKVIVGSSLFFLTVEKTCAPRRPRKERS